MGGATHLHFLWEDRGVCRRFRSAVSLHSHTLYSRERLNFLVRLQERLPWLEWLIRQEANRRGARGDPIDYSRGWWTPPLSAHAAWEHERAQIEDGLGLQALVSLTDHDNVEASSLLHLLEDSSSAPTSVEWTVPLDASFLHLGVHNLPPSRAPELMSRMSACTQHRSEEPLEDLLAALAGIPTVLIVLNHPLWDEKRIGLAAHHLMLKGFIVRCQRYIHAVELNGWRPWRENRGVLELSRSLGLPLVSGGDRHAVDAASALNLTNARTFDEFAQEVRQGRLSHVLLLPPYREPRQLRVIESLSQMLGYYPGHSMGWTRWSDRIFYRRENGSVVSLSQAWGDQQPGILKRSVGLIRLVGGRPLRGALRFALAEKEELYL